MAQEYAAHGVRSVFVYTREAHPGERFPHHTSMEQKLRHARAMVERDGLRRPMLVDDLEGSVHRAYGQLPNMSYIVGGGGRIRYRAAWTDADNLRLALDDLVAERTDRRNGRPRRPYYVEWQPTVPADRETFVRVLLETAGPKAVGEYVAAIGQTMGEAVARPLRAWWEKHPDNPVRMAGER